LILKLILLFEEIEILREIQERKTVNPNLEGIHRKSDLTILNDPVGASIFRGGYFIK
jgi:hypothetical protein